MAQSKNPARAAGMIMILILLSRVLGFVRETLMGRLFSRMETDAFFAAFVIPDLMYYLLVGGALSAAFIPVFSGYLSKGEEKEAWEAGSTFINTTVSALIILTILGMIFSPLLPAIVAPGFEGEKLSLLIRLTRMMFPAVCFTAMAGLLMGVLHSYQHFFAPALGPNIYNIFIIAGAALLGRQYGVGGMAVGVVVGAVSNFLTQLIFLKKKRQFYRPIFNWSHPGFRRMLALMLPAVIGLSVTQINLAVNNALASELAEGSITALRFANRLIQLPLGIFATAISTAFFPTMTRQAASGDMTSFKDTFARSLRFIFFITLPSAVGLIVLRQPIVALLFEGGAFTAEHTAATAYALVFYSVGLAAHAAIQIIPRAFYALQDTITPMFVGIGAVVINIVLNFAFLKFSNLAHGGLALAFSISGILNMLVAMWLLRRKLNGINGRGIVISFMKSLIASVIMGFGTYLAYRFSRQILQPFFTGRMLDLIVVGLGVVTGILLFLVAAYLLKMPELKLVASMVKRRGKGSKQA
ncbi:MAG TPA: murein biosynthesis integral membrane protein MurJ [Firmicutes bacterium]|jgi:putative peptidoglycan lipid II flippase|nr:murein biosynthesis integral membrane protein MurJ [Bacillota bacterium]HAZ21332.1 murein biosynthesis integral membrane protein MurJ [Bacillota bacterium]HBG43545.1 murein biosynthesis integral membrane protein MurJ [Bacillota bacterium]HBL49548.1 murein biosynthesis integral membrane protein MurJ [Bacillota bacterium]HBL67157.1 murein biosynthesis integral membrane protein MurJ [Bacillota bacterium]